MDDTLILSQGKEEAMEEDTEDMSLAKAAMEVEEDSDDKKRRRTGRGFGRNIVYFPRYFDNIPITEVESLPTLDHDSVFKMQYTNDT